MKLATNYNNGLYLAFNKAIVTDVVDKLPLGWSCKTFNAFGLFLIKQYNSTAKVDFKKYSRLFGKDVEGSLAQKHMIMGGNTSHKSWEATCKRFAVSTSYIHGAKVALNTALADSNTISGDEMLEYPIRHGWQSEKYDIILVDECQDLNPQQIKFLSCIPTDRIVFVGDINQAIYGFRGSDPLAIDLIKQQYQPVEYPMHQSFRCPTEILDTVTTIVPHITSNKTGGQVLHKSKTDINYPDTCFITSRTNASLIRLAYKFIDKNIQFSIGAAFVRSIKYRMDSVLNCSVNISDVRNLLVHDYNRDITRYEKNDWNVSALHDRYKGLIAIANNCSSIPEIKAFIKKMGLHTKSGSERKLITIHGVKGLEADHVYFLEPSMCDFFKQRTEIEWEKQQEDNLYYVACTRALKTLTFVE